MLALGSGSAIKVAAVRETVTRAGVDMEVVGLAVKSVVPEQPVGVEETLRGAEHRCDAAAAAAVADGKEVCLGVGIESGMVTRAEVRHSFASGCC